MSHTKRSLKNIVFFLTFYKKIEEPHSYDIAKHDKKWCKAIDEELHVLEKIEHGTYVCYPKIINQLVVNVGFWSN
jgi:hypothetical protein